jgi:hypothetical protein
LNFIVRTGHLSTALRLALTLGATNLAACKTTPKPSSDPAPTPSASHELAQQGLLSDGPFEGEITLRIQAAKEIGTAVYHVKNTRVRMDLPGNEGASAILFDTATRKGALLGPGGATISELTPASIRPPARELPIERTGVVENVGGYTCERWNSREGELTREACVVENVAWAAAAGRLASWLPSGAFPLRVIERNAQGVEVSRLEVVRVDRKPQADSLFAYAPK